MTTLSSSRPRSRPPVPGGRESGRRPLPAEQRLEVRRPEGPHPQRGRSVGRLATSRWARIGLPALAVLCALGAAAALCFPWLSDLYARHEQQVLGGQLDDPAFGSGGSASGAAIGRIVIPAIGVDMVVVQGTDAAALAKGPGHYPDTPMPCSMGNVAIAGHRTTFLHPFYGLNHLKPGDLIELSTRTQTCNYTVSVPPFAVSPKDTAVVANTPGRYVLTLTTCNPIGSSAQRLVVESTMAPVSLRPLQSSTVQKAR